jgi:hypothetical protein
MQIVDNRDPSRIVDDIGAASASALRRVHSGLASEDDRLNAEALMRIARMRGAWLRCACSDEGPLLAPALLAETYYLRRLTTRAAHAIGCPFRNMLPMRESDEVCAPRTRPEPDSFCRPLRRSWPQEQSAHHERQAQKLRPLPVLARELWRILEFAGLNRIDIADSQRIHVGLSSQLAAIRGAARRIRVTRHVRLDEVLSTYPGDIAPESPWHRKALAACRKFRAGEQPQAIMIGLARAVEGRRLMTAAGAIDCASDVALTSAAAIHAGPPFIFILAGVIDPERDRIQPLRAFAQPIVGFDHLIPLESGAERRPFRAVMAFRSSALQKFPSLSIAIEKPLFDIETAEGWLRPPLLLTTSNARTARTETFVVRFEAPDADRVHQRDNAFGRSLLVPKHVQTDDGSSQAAWFIDAIYGAPNPAVTSSIVSGSSRDHAAHAS